MSLLSSFIALFKNPEPVVFPYRYFLHKNRLFPQPTIDVPVAGDTDQEEIRFLVDSGADFTSMPMKYARMLGVHLDKRKKTKLSGIGKDTITAYPGLIDVGIGSKWYSIRCFFVDNDFIPLLGRVDAWGYFSITFNNQKNQVEFWKI